MASMTVIPANTQWWVTVGPPSATVGWASRGHAAHRGLISHVWSRGRHQPQKFNPDNLRLRVLERMRPHRIEDALRASCSHWKHGVIATLNQRHWRWFNVVIISCTRWELGSPCLTFHPSHVPQIRNFISSRIECRIHDIYHSFEGWMGGCLTPVKMSVESTEITIIIEKPNVTKNYYELQNVWPK